jgi:hypothetical protein
MLLQITRLAYLAGESGHRDVGRPRTSCTRRHDWRDHAARALVRDIERQSIARAGHPDQESARARPPARLMLTAPGMNPVARFFSPVVVSLVCALMACSTAINVHTAVAPSARFDRYRTFVFETAREVPPAFEPSPRSSYVRHRVEEMSAAILIGKGYTLAANAPADLRIRVAAGRRTREIRRQVRAHPDWLLEDEEDDFVEGAFVIDAIDNGTGEMVWHGSARVEVEPGKVDEERLRRAVNTFLASFPPRPVPAVAAPASVVHVM